MQRTLLSQARHDLSLKCVLFDLFEMIRVSFFLVLLSPDLRMILLHG